MLPAGIVADESAPLAHAAFRAAEGEDHGDDVTLLLAPPRAITSLSLRAGWVVAAGVLSLTLLGLAGLSIFWPIRVEENFGSYLQCDGPQHGRQTWYREAAAAAKRNDAVQLRKLQLMKHRTQERSEVHYFIKVIYTTLDGSNIFTPAHLAHIREMERRILGCASYTQFCVAMASGECVPPLSVINYFYASVDPTTGDLTPDGQGADLQDIQDILVHMATENQFFVDRYFGVSASAVERMLEGNITRSVFRFGLPFHGFANPGDRLQEQDELFRNFVANELLPRLQQEAASSKSVGLQVNFYGKELSAYEVEMTVWHDALYALGSLAFIAFYLIVHLRSFFLAFAALGCIMLSFPLSYIAYCVCFGYGNMIAINFLSLFVVLGVGADDVFVLADVWSHSRDHGVGDMALARRLWNMYRKAGLAIFATSATTAASFFANLTSSIGPLREFGFFMGTCITVNWLVVASLYPFALVFHERCGRGASARCLGVSAGAGHVAVLRDGVEMEQQLVEDACRGWSGRDANGLHGNGRLASPLEPADSGTPTRTSVGKDATWRGAIATALLCGVVLPGVALWDAAEQIKPDSGVPQFFPPSSNLGALQTLQMRFGNESTVVTQGLKHCDGDGLLSSKCKVISETIPGELVGKSNSSVETGHKSTHSSPEVVDHGAEASKATRDFDLQFSVEGYSPSELEALSFMFKGELLKELELKDDNVEVIVESAGRPTGGSATDDAAFHVRRLDPAASQGVGASVLDKAEGSLLTFHFHELTPAQELRVRSYLSEHQSQIQQYGATELSKVPLPATAEPLSVSPPGPLQLPTVTPSVSMATKPPAAPRRPTVQLPTMRPRIPTAAMPPHLPTMPNGAARTRPQPSGSASTIVQLPRRPPPRPPTTTLRPTLPAPPQPWISTQVLRPTAAPPRPAWHSQQPARVPSMTSQPPTVLPLTVSTLAHPEPTTTNAPFLPSAAPPLRQTSQPPTDPLPTQVVSFATTTFTVPPPTPLARTRPKPTPTASPPSSARAAATTTRPPTSLPPTGPPPTPLARTHSKPATTPIPPSLARIAATASTVTSTTPRRSDTALSAIGPPHHLDHGADHTSRTTTTTTLAVRHMATRPPVHPVPQLNLHKRSMARDRQAMVFMLWGLEPTGSGVSYQTKPDFDMRSPLGQKMLSATCDRAAATPALKVAQVDCWPENFANFLKSRGLPWPSYDTNRDLRAFFGREQHWVGSDLAWRPGVPFRPAWVRVGFRVLFDSSSSGRQIEPFMKEWEAFVAVENFHIKAKGARMLGDAVVTSEIFERAEAEMRVIDSAMSSWIVSVVCALVAVAFFTRSIVLSAIATFAIFATAACSVYTIICIFGWRFGLMEAVSLIIFCGFSVDYPLHVVQAYVQERGKGKKVYKALREVGCAVASGCVTTCGAAAFLLLCEIRLFTRFGQVLIANMLFSLMFALVWIPAVLESRTLCSGCRRRTSAGGPSQRHADRHSGVRAAGVLEEEDALEGFAVLAGGTPRGTPRNGR